MSVLWQDDVRSLYQRCCKATIAVAIHHNVAASEGKRFCLKNLHGLDVLVMVWFVVDGLIWLVWSTDGFSGSKSEEDGLLGSLALLLCWIGWIWGCFCESRGSAADLRVGADERKWGQKTGNLLVFNVVFLCFWVMEVVILHDYFCTGSTTPTGAWMPKTRALRARSVAFEPFLLFFFWGLGPLDIPLIALVFRFFFFGFLRFYIWVSWVAFGLLGSRSVERLRAVTVEVLWFEDVAGPSQHWHWQAMLGAFPSVMRMDVQRSSSVKIAIIFSLCQEHDQRLQLLCLRIWPNRSLGFFGLVSSGVVVLVLAVSFLLGMEGLTDSLEMSFFSFSSGSLWKMKCLKLRAVLGTLGVLATMFLPGLASLSVPKRLAAIGGMGTMLSPSAKHLSSTPFAKFTAVHLRPSAKAERVTQWTTHGAELFSEIDDVLRSDVDALLLCVGKNGDDLPILQRASAEWAGTGRAIFHLSTVSPRFARAAAAHCRRNGLRYGNYPLTGGPTGAEQATMLLLASGDKELYDEYLPLFELLGKPRYFGEDDGRGAEVKLQGQMMVYGGLLGISSAAAASFAVSGQAVERSEPVAEFLDFLNGGAGSTKQWQVAVSRGVRQGDWSEGFLLHHAVIDAIYAAEMAKELNLSSVAQNQLLLVAASFSFLLKSASLGDRIATQALVKAIRDPGLDGFLEPLWASMGDFPKALKMVISSLPESLQERVLLDVDSFEMSWCKQSVAAGRGWAGETVSETGETGASQCIGCRSWQDPHFDERFIYQGEADGTHSLCPGGPDLSDGWVIVLGVLCFAFQDLLPSAYTVSPIHAEGLFTQHRTKFKNDELRIWVRLASEISCGWVCLAFLHLGSTGSSKQNSVVYRLLTPALRKEHFWLL